MSGSDPSEGWQEVLDDLEARRRESRAMGGEERLDKHRGAGKLPARERIAYLVDEGSFREIGTLVGGPAAPADAVIIGSGAIEGRPVMVAAEDFTVHAGTISSAANAKRYRVAENTQRAAASMVSGCSSTPTSTQSTASPNGRLMGSLPTERTTTTGVPSESMSSCAPGAKRDRRLRSPSG
jgi:acetyl-CoA carboxylase carboxyltransferase component